MKCPNCGKKTSGDHCQYCRYPILNGAKASMEELRHGYDPINQSAPEKQPRGWIRRLWLSIGIVLLIIGVFCGLILIAIVHPNPDPVSIVIFAIFMLSFIFVGIYCIHRSRRALGELGLLVSDEKEKQSVNTIDYEPLIQTNFAQVQIPKKSFFTRLKQMYGLADTTRDDIFYMLCSSGVSAQLVKKGNPEETIGKDPSLKSLGLIEVYGEPIRWINIVRIPTGGTSEIGMIGLYYKQIYLIQDSNIWEEGHIIGNPKSGHGGERIEWKSTISGNRIESFEQNKDVIHALLELNRNIIISSYPSYGYWAMQMDSASLPIFIEWAYFKTMAQHLLDTGLDNG